MNARAPIACAVAALLCACGDAGDPHGVPPAGAPAECVKDDGGRYASSVVSFTPGDGAGFGAEEMPDIVLGPPGQASPRQGSLDVVSLGAGGQIVVRFDGGAIVDREGDDFIVWENAFLYGANDDTFAERGEVSVSADGETWWTFSCDPELAPEGCAGRTPHGGFDPCGPDGLRADDAGGDRFDLADVGLTEARWVRIIDLSDTGVAPSAGFDLDAVGALHFRPSP